MAASAMERTSSFRARRDNSGQQTAATRGNEIRVLARSNSLPLIQTLLDHGPLKPRMATKHNLSLQHLRFMLELYRRSADGDGRPKTSRHSGAAVRLVRPVSRASLVTEGQWHIKTFKFKVHGVINAERLVRATVMHPLALRLGVTCFSCTVDLLPNAGHSSKTRIPAGSRMWAETDLTSQLKPLLEGLKNTLYLQLQFICRKAKRCPIKQLAVSSSHIPFLLLYLNHTLHNLATEKRISLEPGQNVPGLLTRKPRQAGTIGVKLPIFPNQSGQSKNQCVLRPFWVSFHQLGWDHWIIAPHRYNPGYCKGDCPRLLHSGYNSPNHAIIQNFINQIDGSVPRPSCVPYSYGPISVLMIEPGGNILYKEYENMMAESCTCR
ncbi:bone morphogenetic protein 15 [Rhinophrynus dorsalis]